MRQSQEECLCCNRVQQREARVDLKGSPPMLPRPLQKAADRGERARVCDAARARARAYFTRGAPWPNTDRRPAGQKRTATLNSKKERGSASCRVTISSLSDEMSPSSIRHIVDLMNGTLRKYLRNFFYFKEQETSGGIAEFGTADANNLACCESQPTNPTMRWKSS